MPLISFEGIDKCGKDTQIGLLAARLTSRGIPHLITRLPGGTDFGQKMRQLLLDANSEISERAEVFLFMADAAQNFEETVKPALKEGTYVISNRGIDSPFAYQGFGRGLPFYLLKAGFGYATEYTVPGITILLDIPPEEAEKRKSGREFQDGDRFESLDLRFHQKVRDGYLSLARQHQDRIVVIDAIANSDLVAYKVFRALGEKYPEVNGG
ncbi:hypothetical protein LCGC14_2511020 [marine sediment metagenome]|uniref:dTMP kinase n=1 Tax=marine sediment metagenome TaxID=412755 RepID=A0A0F9DAW3_9ZZZZ